MKLFSISFSTDLIGNPLFDLENNLPDELFSSGGGWGSAPANVSQPAAQQQPQQQQQQPPQQCVQRPNTMGPNNPGMGMQMNMGPGTQQQQQQQNGSMDPQHHHQLSHMGMQQNKASLNNMSGGAISGSAIGPNNLNMVNSGLSKGPLNNKLNSPPGSAPMAMMNSMGNGPQMMQTMQQQQQQPMNNMMNPSGMGGVNVPMKTPVSMMNASQMGQGMHNGPQSMMGNARPGMPNNMMPQQQQQQQQPPPHRGQLLQGMNPQGPRLQVK